MSYDPHASTCRRTGKISFATRAAATKAMREILNMERDKLRTGRLKTPSKRPMNSYLCAMCNNWHIGHTQKMKVPRTRRRFLHEEE